MITRKVIDKNGSEFVAEFENEDEMDIAEVAKIFGYMVNLFDEDKFKRQLSKALKVRDYRKFFSIVERAAKECKKEANKLLLAKAYQQEK